MGNSRARAVYEANLPDNFRRPQHDSSLESFVRAKYEQKKYIAREWVPPPLQKVNWDKEIEESRKKKDKKSVSATSKVPLPSPSEAQKSPKPIRAPEQKKKSEALPIIVAAVKSSATEDLLGLGSGKLS